MHLQPQAVQDKAPSGLWQWMKIDLSKSSTLREQKMKDGYLLPKQILST